MDKQKDLKYFMKLKYNVILKRANNLYYLFIPELSLIVEAETLDEAYKKLEEEKIIYFKRVVEMDAIDTVKEPIPIRLRKKIIADLATFSLKTIIITSIIFIMFIASLPFMDALFIQKARQIPWKTRELVLDKIDKKLNNNSPERKEEVRLKLRETLQNLKPFINEVRLVLEDEKNTGNNKKVKKKMNKSNLF